MGVPPTKFHSLSNEVLSHDRTTHRPHPRNTCVRPVRSMCLQGSVPPDLYTEPVLSTHVSKGWIHSERKPGVVRFSCDISHSFFSWFFLT